MATSTVTGADDVARALDDLSAALADLGGALATTARARAAFYAPSRARLDGTVVSGSSTALSYLGVISPAGFAKAIDTDITRYAAQDLEHEVNNAIQRAGLT
ncbi:hypothetical protein [Nocardioides sp.]|jgi:hypothetical protein|uniref:hypothetical protein n=1 Tax=Nocardioides sp. TaxID=35761 RepID=UPI00262CF4EE|nr:hypothetical protein [Nocardioides sp.]